MTFLTLTDPNTVPAARKVDGSPRTVFVNYAQVTEASELARHAFEGNDPAAAVKELANSVFALCGLLTELVAGLEQADIAIVNYPVEDAHLN
jgi:hypothetical protein